MSRDVIINKISSIRRCVKRAREEYHKSRDFSDDWSAQDAAKMNIIRAAEQTIDLANYILRREKQGVPTTSAQSFELLVSAGVIKRVLADKLKKMVAFRNISIHEYQRVETEIVRAVLEKGLDDFLEFCDFVLRYDSATQGF